MTVSLIDILAAARAHAAPLAAESAGYLLLAVADHVAVAPRPVSAEDVELSQDGTVKLRPLRGAAAADATLERSLRLLLARALEVASSVGPALRRASERRDDAGLPALVRELETALIPVNRSAAKRALTRLHRETERARASGKLKAALKNEATREVAPVRVQAPVPAPVEVVEPLLSAAEFPDVSPAALPVVEAVPLPVVEAVALPVVETPTPAPRIAQAPAPMPVLTLTPEPKIAVGDAAFTKPEPVVQRKRERAGRTPQLGTVVTALTMPGEEGDRVELTERAPAVDELSNAPEARDDELEIDVDVELEADAVAVVEMQADPEPSCMPDVVLAMVQLHANVAADEAPTRLRDVVTAVRAMTPAPVVVLEPVEPVLPVMLVEQVDPSVHEALTWNPGPVVPSANEPPPLPDVVVAPVPVPVAVAEAKAEPEPEPELEIASSVPAAFLIAEPPPELSPYAPAVLPARSSDVSELLDSFYVSGAAEEHELRSALKEMAGLSLTPMPLPLIEEG